MSLFSKLSPSINRGPLALSLILLSLQACAQDSGAGAPEVAAVDTSAVPAEYAYVVEALPGVAITDVRKSPVPGLLEVMVGSDVYYISEDGKYFVQGEVVELATRVNVTDKARSAARAVYMENFSAATAVTFAAEEEKYKVLVFTDIDCPYCRKLHREISEYNDLGITVQYLMFPRSGPNTDSWAKAEAVLCSESRQDALTASKNGEEVDAEACATQAVAEHYKLGKDLGIGGTPAIFTEQGGLIVGYREADVLLSMLEEEAG